MMSFSKHERSVKYLESVQMDFLYIPVAQAVAKIPTDSLENEIFREMATGKVHSGRLN